MTPNYLSALGNHLWQSTIVVGLAALLARVLSNNSAGVRYWVWFAAAMKFLIPFSLLVTIGQQFEWRTSPTITHRPIETVSRMSTPFAMPSASSTALPMSNSDAAWFVLAFVWFGGFAVAICHWYASWRRVRAALKYASPLDVSLPFNTRVPVMTARGLLEPAVVGIFRPILLLPDGISARMPPDQFKAILFHEICHIRRRDNLTSALYMLSETIFWFYPIVRWVGKRLIDERECACDEEVLRRGNEPLVYAEGILHICKAYVESPLRCAPGVTGADPKKRIQIILASRIGRDLDHKKKAVLVLAAIVTVLMPVALGVLNAPMRAQAQSADDAIVGTWKLNVTKSNFSGTRPPQSAVQKVEARRDGMKSIFDMVTPEGKRIHSESSPAYDGKDHPVTGDQRSDTVSVRRTDANHFETTWSKEGKVVATARNAVSRDGKTWTQTISTTNIQGKAVTIIAVYDKQ